MLVIFKILCYISKVNFYGGIGEVVNTADCGSVMQGFDSLISPHEDTNYDSVSYRNFSFI